MRLNDVRTKVVKTSNFNFILILDSVDNLQLDAELGALDTKLFK